MLLFDDNRRKESIKMLINEASVNVGQLELWMRGQVNEKVDVRLQTRDLKNKNISSCTEQLCIKYLHDIHPIGQQAN